MLCSVISPRGERWLGGQFLSPDRVLVWTDDGKAYMYRLPAKYVILINLGYFYVNSYYDLLVNWYLLISLNCRRWRTSKYPKVTKQYHLSEL